MSIECAECERDLRGGHDKACSRYRPNPPCPACGQAADILPGWECADCGHIWSLQDEKNAQRMEGKE